MRIDGAGATAAILFLILLLFVLWTIRTTRLRRAEELREARLVHGGQYDAQLREVDLGPMTRGDAEKLMRRCYRASEADHPDADARLIATHLALFRDRTQYLEISCIAPDHIDVRAAPAITGHDHEELVTLHGYPALYALVDAYYDDEDGFAHFWDALPMRMRVQ